MSSETLLTLYSRLAEKDLNVMSVAQTGGTTSIVVEYLYKRKKDDKPVWPKLAVQAASLSEAVLAAETLIDTIRDLES